MADQLGKRERDKKHLLEVISGREDAGDPAWGIGVARGCGPCRKLAAHDFALRPMGIGTFLLLVGALELVVIALELGLAARIGA